MISYKSICDKLGFDPMVDGKRIEPSDHEVDTFSSPFEKLSLDEAKFLANYLIDNKQKITQYVIS